ncbi:hypothetical protein B0I35DRAFT_276090 [Stachybotrys elegans]|uniref:P-loop containing nucleoside triphosphate hydrolase protein n=1 Tax=Stachybotrys elegans TaxID=80388 RepID=A0A8K0WP21_9HYPO|nr:hypothetical protein B0I35DRAFT_276090 [Stachybotrys elegans]
MENREMKVLAMGLPRTGTASMAKALEILGYQGVYHGIKAIDTPQDWVVFSRAADATFPSLPTYTGKPFTQEDWEELYRNCEATTDLASVFGKSLTSTYPNAKVVLVIRDYDKWYKSIDEMVLKQLWGPLADFSVNYVEWVLGSQAGPASRKLMLGFFQAKDADEARRNARAAYDRHHKEIQEAVPQEQLLVYHLGDGWEPLCKFLDKPVPEGVEFPWVNEAEMLRKTITDKAKRDMTAAAMKLLPWVVGAGAIGAGSWMVMKGASLSG